jgi:hypothetical protein
VRALAVGQLVVHLLSGVDRGSALPLPFTTAEPDPPVVRDQRALIDHQWRVGDLDRVAQFVSEDRNPLPAVVARVDG